jgi:dienelactone hydrolase
VTQQQLTAYHTQAATNHWWTSAPINPPLLERYRKETVPAWKRSLQVEFVERGLMVQPEKITKAQDYTATRMLLGRAGKGDKLQAMLITPRRDALRTMVVLAHPEGRAAFLDAKDEPKGLARKLIDRGLAVLLLDTFQPDGRARDYGANFFTTYNRTEVQERVQDLVTACAFAQAHSKGRRVALYGAGRAGLWAMLAAPASDALVADCSGFDSTDDRNLLAADLFSPGLRKLGAFEGVASINAGNPLLLFNTGDRFTTSFLRKVYRGMHVPERFREEKVALTDDEISQWIAEMPGR